MSLKQAQAFYQALCGDTALYVQYLTRCSCQLPCLDQLAADGDRHWDETEILNFAQSQGYSFSLSELYQVWFGQPDYRTDHSREVGARLSTIAQLNRLLA